MAEFKVNSALSAEISGLQGAGEQLMGSSAPVSSEEVSTLAASVKFIEEHTAIIALLKLYQSLIAKEAADLSQMKQDAEALDAKIASKVGK